MVKSAKDLAAEINKTMGSSVIKMGDADGLKVTYIPSGVAPIDNLLGGGFARGRAVELFGNYSTLKSYIGLKALAEAQKVGVAALVDTEHAFDPEWATSLGVNIEDLILMHPETGEEAVDATELLIRNHVDLVVWDSVAATLPKAEAAKRAVDSQQPARLAQLMSSALRKLTAANSVTALVFINQTRINVGQMFGNPEKATGGMSLPFYASQRVAMRKAGALTRPLPKEEGGGKETYGMKVRATLEKSKLNTPHRDIMFEFLYGEGIDALGSEIKEGIAEGRYAMSKGWYWLVPDTKGAKPKKMREKDFREWLEANLFGPVEPVKRKVGRPKKKS